MWKGFSPRSPAGDRDHGRVAAAVRIWRALSDHPQPDRRGPQASLARQRHRGRLSGSHPARRAGSRRAMAARLRAGAPAAGRRRGADHDPGRRSSPVAAAGHRADHRGGGGDRAEISLSFRARAMRTRVPDDCTLARRRTHRHSARTVSSRSLLDGAGRQRRKRLRRPVNCDSAHTAAPRTSGLASASRRSASTASARSFELPIAISTLRMKRSRPMRLTGDFANQCAKRRVVEPRQLGEIRRAQVVARGEFCLVAGLRELVPRADREAIVAAIDAVADGFAKFARDRSLVLDGEIGNAAPRIELVGRGKRRGRADVEAGPARAAMIGVGLIARQIERR